MTRNNHNHCWKYNSDNNSKSTIQRISETKIESLKKSLRNINSYPNLLKDWERITKLTKLEMKSTIRHQGNTENHETIKNLYSIKLENIK